MLIFLNILIFITVFNMYVIMLMPYSDENLLKLKEKYGPHTNVKKFLRNVILFLFAYFILLVYGRELLLSIMWHY